jgi:hypothetical protein
MKIWAALAAVGLGLTIAILFLKHDLRGWTPPNPSNPASVVEPARRGDAAGKRTPATPTDIEQRLGEIASTPTHLGKARLLGTNIAGHFIAPVLGLMGLLFILGGLSSYGLAYYLH